MRGRIACLALVVVVGFAHPAFAEKRVALVVGNSAYRAALDQAIQDFGRQIQRAEVAMFYYAGHGVQVRGTNYLVSVNANPSREADVDFQMVDVNLVLNLVPPQSRDPGEVTPACYY